MLCVGPVEEGLGVSLLSLSSLKCASHLVCTPHSSTSPVLFSSPLPFIVLCIKLLQEPDYWLWRSMTVWFDFDFPLRLSKYTGRAHYRTESWEPVSIFIFDEFSLVEN